MNVSSHAMPRTLLLAGHTNSGVSTLESPYHSCARAYWLQHLWLGAQRQFNTAHLLAHYMGDQALSGDAIAWNRNDPNILSIRLPGGSFAP